MVRHHIVQAPGAAQVLRVSHTDKGFRFQVLGSRQITIYTRMMTKVLVQSTT